MNKYMDGLEYEKFCAEWLRKHGYHHVELTKASRDQGVDIIAYKHGQKYGFQCKYYQTPVGNEAVQEVYSGAAYYHCDVACVITNNTYTKTASSLADETDVLLYEKIIPVERNFLSLIFRLLSLFLFFSSLYLVYCQSRMINYSETKIFIFICMLISGSCGFFSNHYSNALIGFLLSALAAILLYTQGYSMYFILLISFYSAFLLIRVIIFQKNRYFEKNQIIQNELKNAIEDSTDKLGRHLQDVLCDEFGCDIQLKESKHINNALLEFTFHANRDIQNDIALVEYSLNQYALYEDHQTQFKLEAISSRNFCLKMTK